MTTSVVMGAMFLFSGCGSSDTPDTSSVPTGTAYYIDSAVSGVNYTCGSTEGITGSEGEFTFEIGGSCTFYLGDIELRAVDAGLLVDGESVYETDVEIARTLQSLDSDGDPNNGITIDTELVAAIAAAGITELPDTVAEMDELLAVIEAAGGTVLSEDDAMEHLLTTLLGGKTFYDVGQQVSDATDTWSGEVTFNANLTEVSYIGSGSTEVETVSISVTGNRLVFGSQDSYTLIGENKGDYIEVTDYYSDGTLESNTRLYFDQTKADAYFASL